MRVLGAAVRLCVRFCITNRKHEVQPVDLLEQEPLLPVTLEEFFPRDFFRKVAVNMVSCSELEDGDSEEDVQEDVQEASAPSTDDKVLAVLEVLPERMSWKQIFHLPEECANRLQLPCTMQSCMLIK